MAVVVNKVLRVYDTKTSKTWYVSLNDIVSVVVVSQHIEPRRFTGYTGRVVETFSTGLYLDISEKYETSPFVSIHYSDIESFCIEQQHV